MKPSIGDSKIICVAERFRSHSPLNVLLSKTHLQAALARAIDAEPPCTRMDAQTGAEMTEEWGVCLLSSLYSVTKSILTQFIAVMKTGLSNNNIVIHDLLSP